MKKLNRRKRAHSRMLGSLQTCIVMRSKPMLQPAWGGLHVSYVLFGEYVKMAPVLWIEQVLRV